MAASAADSKTADFNSGLPTGWELKGDAQCADERARDDKGKCVFSRSKSATDNYLLTSAVQGSLTFFWRSYGTSSTTTYQQHDRVLGHVESFP